MHTSQQVITSYEREVNKPDSDKLPEIAEILGYSIETLFNPDLRFIKNSSIEKKPRKGSRLSKIQELYDQLKPDDQRFLLRQVEGLVGK